MAPPITSARLAINSPPMNSSRVRWGTQAGTCEQRLQPTADDAGDAGNAAVAQDVKRGRRADQQAAGQRAPGGEEAPLDVHDVNPAGCLRSSTIPHRVVVL